MADDNGSNSPIVPLPVPPPRPQVNHRGDLSDAQKLVLNRLFDAGDRYVANVMSRAEFMRAGRADRRRDVGAECGHPPSGSINISLLTELYERNPIAARVVEVYPRECWEVQPTVYEDEDIGTTTPFEEAWKELGKGFDEGDYFQDERGSVVWNYLKQVDELSGIGRYGVLLLGLDDGKSLDQPAAMRKGGKGKKTTRVPLFPRSTPSSSRSPADPTTPYTPGNPSFNAETPPSSGSSSSSSSSDSGSSVPKRELTFLRVFPENLAEVVELDSDPKSRRYGQPVKYRMTFNDPRNFEGGVRGVSAQVHTVHWTRVIHIADTHHTASPNEWFARPRMLPVLNRLLDVDKLYGSSAEMYWLGAFPGLAFKAISEEGIPPTISDPMMKSEIENYINGLQRFLRLVNMDIEPISPQVVDPSPQIERQLEAICVKIRMPKRIFMGSERGELASSQDDATWNDRKRERHDGYITPRIIRPFVNRLIALGVLPVPEGYSVCWPDLSNQTASEKADVAFKVAQSFSQYADSSAGVVITPTDFLVKVIGLPEEEAKKITENAKKEARKALKEQQKQQEQQMAAQATDKTAWVQGVAGVKKPETPTPPGVPGAPGSPAAGPPGSPPAGPPGASGGLPGASKPPAKPSFLPGGGGT